MLSLLLLGLAAAKITHAWGDLGHETIAYIAQNLVSSSTRTWAQQILNDTSASYLASVATWADTYKYTSQGTFSQPFHFIDAEDNPPVSCDVDYDRDCGNEGCSVSAIANYTEQVMSPGKLSHMQVNYALRFLVHFIGDITQPLHDEAILVGGNEVPVTFDGEATDLHAIWDTNMPEQLVRGDALSDARTWAANLTQEIRSGAYHSMASSWLSGLDINNPKASAMIWAKDANAFVCSVVMPNNVTVLEDGDLYPKYYESVIGTVELQIAKAGYRLAAWLDGLAGARNGTTVGLRRRAIVGVDLSGRELLPVIGREKSRARLAREALGWGCGHNH